MAKKPNTNTTKGFIGLKCFKMYQNGSSLNEIAQHFHISKEHVSDSISSYINNDMIHDAELQRLHNFNRMNRTSNHVAEIIAWPEKAKEETQKETVQPEITGNLPTHASRPSEPQTMSWLQRCCAFIKRILTF